jgi:hypothetical protein
MLQSRRISVLSAVALFTIASLGFGQSFSRHKGGSTKPFQSPPRATACGPDSVTESSSNAITSGNSVHCQVGDNSYWRAFTLGDFGIDTDYAVCEVVVGIEQALSGSGTGQPVTVNLYTSSQAFPTGYPGSLTLIGTASVTVADQSLTLLTIPVTGTAPAGSQLAVEIATTSADGNQLFIGSNTSAETAPSYLLAASCGAAVPTPTDGLLPGLIMHIVMTVDGTAVIPVAPASLVVDPPAATIQVSGNGVLELNEDAVIRPGWTNSGNTDVTLTGAIQHFTGPTATLIFTINDQFADYGTISAGTTKDCGLNCYSLNATGVRSAQPTHLDLSVDEYVTPANAPPLANAAIKQTWVLHVGDSFTDVAADGPSSIYYPAIETILHKGVTAGCGAGIFCPTSFNLRQEMAVFLLKASQGAGYTPPACASVFSDVPCPATVDFPYSDWIEDIYARNITAGCSSDPGPPPTIQYCPDRNVLRSEMAVFLLKASQAPGYTPPACANVFSDVPCPATVDFPYSDWIEAIYALHITAGCSVDPGPPPTIQYCPNNPVLRQEMAVFLTRTFGLVLYGP